MSVRSNSVTLRMGAGLNEAASRGKLMTINNVADEPECVVTTAPANNVVGVLDELPHIATAGGYGGVITHGIVQVTASAAVDVGDSLTASSQGRVAKQAVKTSNDRMVSLTKGAAGDVLDVVLL